MKNEYYLFVSYFKDANTYGNCLIQTEACSKEFLEKIIMEETDGRKTVLLNIQFLTREQFDLLKG